MHRGRVLVFAQSLGLVTALALAAVFASGRGGFWPLVGLETLFGALWVAADGLDALLGALAIAGRRGFLPHGRIFGAAVLTAPFLLLGFTSLR